MELPTRRDIALDEVFWRAAIGRPFEQGRFGRTCTRVPRRPHRRARTCRSQAHDPDFGASGDRVSYVVDVGDAPGPLSVAVALMYQPIAYRWAHDLRGYTGLEPARFVAYYEAMSHASAVIVAQATAVID